MPANENAYIKLQSNVRRIGHIFEHTPNNIGQLIRGNRQVGPEEYFTETQNTYIQQIGTNGSSTNGVARQWSDWHPEAVGHFPDGWRDQDTGGAYLGFRMDEGDSAEAHRH